ncbi:PaaI family thioesterase [Aquabacterium sp. CECT 9606]|uniref:PaaI family thioesterase n=1 Tax=Aquabacterium sp. CECT 9606 TaxID=2845822 RepID=UPI001E3534CA|nr:PaaI family thioesterase [Aquabacterium sp. CECT 9606]CAH0353221.1 hypothetical protein AQB9606_03122 [Aquabacterium sp. CECT 9606]
MTKPYHPAGSSLEKTCKAEPNSAIHAARQFSNAVPHNFDLGMIVESMSSTAAVMRLPYRNILMGDSEKDWLYSSTLYSLADAASGMAVFCALNELTSIATLDMRIDYLRPTPIGRDLLANATCYRLTRQVAFTRCSIYLADDDEICAIATGTFYCGKRSATHTIKAKRDSI